MKNLSIEQLEFNSKYAYLGLDDPYNIKTKNPIEELFSEADFWRQNPEVAYLKIMSNPDYIPFACKHLFGIEIPPIQHMMLRELLCRPFPMLIASRGGSKTFSLALFSCLKSMMCPGHKTILMGAGFRQSKLVFGEMVKLYRNSKMFRALCPTTNNSIQGPRTSIDMCTFTMGDSTVIALPVGNGEKIRGFRANTLIADEFASIPIDVYEVVAVGFTLVSADPVKSLKDAAKRRLLANIGINNQLMEENATKSNQQVIAGTSFYDFNHFASYWKQYKEIINSKGDKDKLYDLLGDIALDRNFNWKDYSILRIPYDYYPEGMIDQKQVLRNKATTHTGNFQMEYGCIFSKDSTGFYKRSLIEACVANEKNNIQVNGETVIFSATTRGNPNCKYIFGVDPASEDDNLAIVILEIHENHRRVVYCWTTNRKRYKEAYKQKLIDIDDYYSFCARKIRELMRYFPCEKIALDPQGGGIAILEALSSTKNMSIGEQQLWPVIDNDSPKDTDHQQGLHIIDLANFHKEEYTSQANHGLRQDLENKILLFPFFDAISLVAAGEDDKIFLEDDVQRPYDTLEDCLLEINEIKDELTTITITRTKTGREHWDTPEVRLAENKKRSLRKDRYTALMMANMTARLMINQLDPNMYPKAVGGLITGKMHNDGGNLYSSAPESLRNSDWGKQDGFGQFLNQTHFPTGRRIIF